MDDLQTGLNGSIFTPGFIATQVNGAYGFGCSDPHGNIRGGCAQIARKFTENGGTSLYLTIITLSKEAYYRIVLSIYQPL